MISHVQRSSVRLIRLIGLALMLMVINAACTPSGSPPRETIIPFPTMTPGRVFTGLLPAPEGILLDGSRFSNPATAVAEANRPTPTPDSTACPVVMEGAVMLERPETNDAIIAEIERFLTAGGDPLVLEDTLENEWDIVGINGYVRSDLDLTGEGTPDVVVGYTVPSVVIGAPATPDPGTPTPTDTDPEIITAPSGEGVLLILGCRDRRVQSLYRTRTDESAPPELLLIGDVNRDRRTDLLFTTRNCDVLPCVYQTNLVTWEAAIGRFASLLGVTVLSENLPTITDIDSDEVSEIVVRRDFEGDEDTGPIRTGLNIYDWNGQVYVLSIVQPDPPRYLIQVIHEADRFFARREMSNAIQLYEVAITDTDLLPWLRDETPSLRSYALYRQVVAQTFSNDPNLLTTYNLLGQLFPQTEPATAYVAMARAFWDEYQTNNDLSRACDAALAVVAQRPDAVELLNLYGRRSPRYEPGDLCPF
ncbi:MAG: hypothetical protein SF029_06055 [bacterium]|nr:hypothetical protein [bacterium]